MERETKTITTPSGQKLVIKSYLTAGERNALRRVFLEAVSVDTKGNVGQVPATVVDLAESKLIELLVVSFGTFTSNADIVKCLNEGKPEDYDFVVAELNKLNSGLTQAK